MMTTAVSILIALLAAWGAVPTVDAEGSERPVSLQTAGCGLAVALALFAGGQVLA